MNFRNLSTPVLLATTKIAVIEERKSLLKVLHLFREIERRRAYHPHSSLYVLAIKEYGYSHHEANARITAMRLIRDVPEMENKIESGALCLTNAIQAQSYFRRAKVAKPERLKLAVSFCNKTTREVEKAIARLEPEKDKRADFRYSSDKRIRMSITISEEDYQAAQSLMHELRVKSVEEVFSILLKERKRNDALALRSPDVKSRHIPAVTKKIVMKTNEKKCAYKNPATGEECTETHKLEFDHIHPFSKGGAHVTENLRLLCPHHNKVVWRTEQKKM